jgi:hypothetical protein
MKKLNKIQQNMLRKILVHCENGIGQIDERDQKIVLSLIQRLNDVQDEIELAKGE